MAKLSALTSYCAQHAVFYRTDEPMKRHTTFKIGGPAAFYAEPDSVLQLKGLLRACRAQEVEAVVIGNGSNLLVSDEGIDGAVICLGPRFSGISLMEDGLVLAEAGATLAHLCRFAADNALSGLEFAYGIPGSVGGGVYMNAGAYGGEMRDVVLEVHCLDDFLAPVSISAEACDFGYRHSLFMQNSHVVTGAVFALSPGDRDDICGRMEDIMARRIQKQPLELPSAGSVFRRPEGAFAAALIEQCGLKGRRIGGAQVSAKHAGFIVNTGGATCRDVEALIALIQSEVRDRTGYTLDCEIKRL
jgi:UDP-N-acetylmuramate dehydrogenase